MSKFTSTDQRRLRFITSMASNDSDEVGSSTDVQVQEFCDVLNDMKNGLASVKETIKALQEKCVYRL